MLGRGRPTAFLRMAIEPMRLPPFAHVPVERTQVASAEATPLRT